MSRKQDREQAFLLLFEVSLNPRDIADLVAEAQEVRDERFSPVAVALATGTMDESMYLDKKIATHSLRWSKERISKVALAILRLAIYEMDYVEKTPVSVAINEAVELAKKFGTDDDAPFVNGVLGGIARSDGGEKADGLDG